MSKEVADVAYLKAPVFLTLQSVILRWPDRTIGVRYVTGYSVIGEMERAGILREVLPDLDQPVGTAALLATNAEHMPAMRARVKPGFFVEVLLAQPLQGARLGDASVDKLCAHSRIVFAWLSQLADTH